MAMGTVLSRIAFLRISGISERVPPTARALYLRIPVSLKRPGVSRMPRSRRVAGRPHAEHAVHHPPVARKRADVRIVARLRRRAELHRHASARARRAASKTAPAALGHVVLRRRAARDRRASRRRPRRSARASPARPSNEVVRHHVGVGEHQLDELSRRAPSSSRLSNFSWSGTTLRRMTDVGRRRRARGRAAGGPAGRARPVASARCAASSPGCRVERRRVGLPLDAILPRARRAARVPPASARAALRRAQNPPSPRLFCTRTVIVLVPCVRSAPAGTV